MRVRLKTDELGDILARSKRSQNAWALRIGISRGHWSDLVNGKHPYPSPKTRELMLDALGAEFDAIFEVESAAPDSGVVGSSLDERYVVDRVVGEGAMGTVYLARDLRFGRRVAIKMVSREAIAGLSERFIAETRNTGRLQHPNVLPLLDAGTIEDQPYYVTPFIEDGSLRERLDQGPLPLREALGVLRDMAAAIDYAHGEEILHCDIKPENVLLAGEHAYVADFGLSRAIHIEAVREWDRPPEVDIAAGTPAYVSPEQARAELSLDARSDVYSLACVAFEMLTGRTPFSGGSTTEVVKRRFDSVPPDLRRLAPGIPEAIASVVAAGMALDPADRPRSASEFMRRLELATTTAPSSDSSASASQQAFQAITTWALARASNPRPNIMRNLIEDLRFSVRSLMRRPLFAIVAIVTLALGIGANTAIFSVVNAVVLRPLPYPEPEQLVRISSQYEGRTCCPISTPNFLDLREQTTQLQSMVAYSSGMAAVSGSGEPVRLRTMRVNAGYFEMLGAEPQLGRFIGTTEDTFGSELVAVISDQLWRDRYEGRSDVIGETIRMDSRVRTIIGVAPQEFREGSSTSIYIPFAWDPENLPSRNQNANLTLARLATGASVESALAELRTLYGEIVNLYPDQIANKGIDVEPYSDFIVGDRQRRPLYMLWGAVGMVLLVACANVVNLMLARAEARHRELAVRSALGATRARILWHFLAESLMVSLVGAAVGIACAYGSLQFLLSNFGGAIPRSGAIGIDSDVLLFSLAIAVGTGFLVGLVPVIWQRSGDASAALGESTRGQTGNKRRLREVLVALQVAVALILVIGAGLMLKSFWRLSQVDVGVDPERLGTVRISLPISDYPEASDRIDFFNALRDRVAELPSVESVGLASAVPFTNTFSNFSAMWPVGNPDRKATFVESRTIDPHYFETLGLSVRLGRNFSTLDQPDTAAGIIVNAEFARQLFEDENPIGRAITAGPGSEWEILGLAEDVREHGPDRRVPPTAYFSHSQTGRTSLALTIRSDGDPLDVMPDIRGMVRELDADLPVFGINRFDRLIANGFGSRRFTMSLLGTFAAIAMTLGAIGIYGMMAYSVECRTREIGLRQALGASPGSVLRMVVGQGTATALVGVALGVVGA